MSPLLFNILISDIEEEIEKIKWKGMRIKEKRIYSLMYGDDMVMLAEGEDEMKSMIGRLEVDEKRLVDLEIGEVNIEKTKIMRFRRWENEKDRLEMERKEDSGNKRVQVSRVCGAKEWATGGASGG